MPAPVVASHLGSEGWARTTTCAPREDVGGQRALGVGVDLHAPRAEDVGRARVGRVGGMRGLHRGRDLRADGPGLLVGLVEEHADYGSQGSHALKARR